MRGREVFYPVGWDDNGLPTERRVQNYFGVRCDPALPYQAGLSPPEHDAVALKSPSPDRSELVAYLSDDAPIPSPSWTLHGQLGRGAALKRLWTG